MQEQAKLIVAEQLDGQKHQFLIFKNSVVGEGGFGVVKKAIRNDKPQQELVSKIIPYENEAKREKIEKEVSVIRKLPLHPNLVTVQPLKCYSSKNYYIFMEYCPDGTLEDLIRKKKGHFTEDEIFDIFYQLLNGYKVLYNAKILHQDLKPENVLIKNGTLKLTDFGFSIFYQGFKYGQIRQGTLPYMPIEKLTQKDYYANTKSDVYSMGVILFRIITGHHPYVLSRGKEYRSYLKELKANPLYLKPNFSNRFSIKFQHFFDLVLSMVSKHEQSRVDFDTVYNYIETEEMFEEIIRRHHSKEELEEYHKSYQKFVITQESDAIAIPFNLPEHEEEKYRKEAELKNQVKKNVEEEKIIQKIDGYIAAHRIIVYFFDRLTRRIYVEKLKKFEKSEAESANSEKVILGFLLFCKKVIQGLVKEFKTGNCFPISEWKVYRKSDSSLLKVIERDENYLEDLVIDCLSESSQTKIKERKQLLDKSKEPQDIFGKVIKSLLQELLEYKISLMRPDDKASMITICYVLSGLDILQNYEKWEKEALELEPYFRKVQTEDCEVLFSRVVHELQEKKIDFSLDLGMNQ